jgi:hypothetical protein
MATQQPLTAGGIAILPSIDAIQEFQGTTYTYWRMGYPRGPTARYDQVGINKLHGSLFEFFRNTNSMPSLISASRPKQ